MGEFLAWRVDLGTGILRNKTNGGDGVSGVIMSNVTRNKMSTARKGGHFSEEHKAKISAANKGKIISLDTRLKMITAANNRSAEHQAKISLSNKNRPMASIETRRKMSNASKGKPKSAEHRNKISISLKGKIVSDETRTKFKNKIVSEETRKKISASKLGHAVPEVTKEKMRNAKKKKSTKMCDKIPKIS